MKSILTYLTVLLFFVSCGSDSNNEETQGQHEDEKVKLTSFKDHVLYLNDYFSGNPISGGVQYDEIKPILDLGAYSDKYSDSIILEFCTLKRQFRFDDGLLTTVKYSSYTNSSGISSSSEMLKELVLGLEKLLGTPDKKTLYSTQWTIEGANIKYKVFPNEGIDFTISVSNNHDHTACVGDWQSAKSRLIDVIKSLLTEAYSFEDLSDETFDGFLLNFENEEITLLYNCETSKKLLLIDRKSLISSLTDVLGINPNIKDEMYFWQLNDAELQLINLQNGYSIKLIN